eukprot:TRINITY_DN870_c0_g1_i2.p1 TRINITY_DN870_c0_g1~~TRINITY_DN870_c0_g1_i2.p1  ORF type:complete len:374 (+),score=64.96 TRINITY_DN870_c0_g1_i2:83-1204(+)
MSKTSTVTSSPTTPAGSSSTPLPIRMQYAIRTGNLVQWYQATPTVKNDPSFSEVTGNGMKFTKDGVHFAVLNLTNLTVYDSSSATVKTVISRPNINNFCFSPKGTYLLTWERLTPELQNGKRGNLVIWEVETGNEVANFVQKSNENFPLIRWSSDETVAARLVSTEIQFFTKSDFSNISHRCKQIGVSDFSFAPGPSPLLAVFLPPKSGQPGFVRILKSPAYEHVVASKTLMKGQSVNFTWNPLGKSLLFSSHTDVDKTGKSYYGESGIHYLTTDAKQFTGQVGLDKEGAIHKCTWAPDGRTFVVVYGFMPAKTAIFDQKCVKIADLYPEGAPRNTAKFSPCGRMLCSAGFGNLAGHVDIWWVTKRPPVKLGS